MIVGLAATLSGTAQQPPETPPPAGTQPPDTPESVPAPPSDDQTQPVFRTDINFVRVDVVVTDDDDNLVLDLTAEDFEIYEDDILQHIESSELIVLTGEPDPRLPPPSSIRNAYDIEREAARSDSRMFVFFLDDYHVSDLNAMRVLAPLVEFVETQLTPTDLVAVMYPLTPVIDMQFTRDHARIVEALQGFKGRKYDYDPLNVFEQRYVSYPTTTIEKIRNDVSMSALRGLAIHLGGLREGRKSIIVLSEGYSNYVPPQLRNGYGGQIAPQRSDPFAADSLDEENARDVAGIMMLADLVYLADIANKNNTTFDMVDPRGLAVFEYDLSLPSVSLRADAKSLRTLQNSLRTLAEQTDGRAIINRNDVLPGLAQILRDQSGYYLLGYTSSEAPTDGEYHEIEVKVARKDVDIRARPGYYALSEDDVKRVLASPKPEAPRAVDIALGTLAEPVRGRLVRTWVGMRRGDNGKARVTFVWEPVSANQAQRRESASQVTLMAMSDSAAHFRGQVPEQGNASRRADFEADAGVLELNVAIEDEYGDVIDRVVNEVTVPDFTGTDVTLSTPTVVRARNALEVRQFKADPDALPTASRYFRRTDQVLVRVEAYAPGDIAPVVTGRLLNRQGTTMMELPVDQPAAGGPYELTLQLAPFPRGDYLVEISAAAGDDVATTLIAFRIQG